MSANQSNLSGSRYGYDMVVATTQAAIDATMKEWLSKHSGGPFTQAYLFDPTMTFTNSGPALTDFERLKEEMGFDPFSIPDQTAVTDQRIAKLLEKKFMFAFQIEIGLPDFPLDKIPPVIELNKEGSNVTYNMVCKTFKIIAIEAPLYGTPAWRVYDQDKYPEPWVFQFSIDLDLRKDNITNHFHDLPEETQQMITAMGENMFSVQQLFLDLNAAGLKNTVEIKGLDKTGPLYAFLTGVFINKYIDNLSKNGGIMLGYSVVSQDPFPQNVSIIPTSMNFEVSSYKDPSGKATADFEAYTLNYLIMAKNRPMPVPVQFAWNWVEKEQLSQYAGVMSVNRDTFVLYLHGLLSPSLNSIAKRPTVYFHCNCVQADFTYGCVQEADPQFFNVVKDGGTHILSYSFSKYDQSSDSTFCGIYETWGNISATYSVQTDVYLDGTIIRVETVLTMNMHLNSMGGVVEGNFAKKKAVTKYTIGVDAYGKITVDRPDPEITDLSDNVSPDWWLQFISLGQINDVVDSMRNNAKGWLDNFLKNDSSAIQQMLNGSQSWVFPGGKTYAFKNALFSDNQDLTANVLYIAPKTSRAEIASLLKAARLADSRQTLQLQS